MSSPTHQVIERFLSRLQDQYNKNSYWRKNVRSLWIDAFERVPTIKLQQLFDRYFQRECGPFLPALSHVIDFVRADVGEKYFLIDRGTYCHHCREDPKGTHGGFRRIECSYYDPKAKDGAGDNIVFDGVARCDCEASKGSGGNYKDYVRRIYQIDPHATIRVSSQDDTMAVDNEQLWTLRIARGYVRLCEDECGQFYEPVWSNRFWRSAMGFAVAHQLGWEMPPAIAERFNKAQRRRRANLNIDSMDQGQAMSAVIDLITHKTLEDQ
jgi:hypothetical protein